MTSSYDGLGPGQRSATSTVPAGAPSDDHSSSPSDGRLAVK
jgi:hypothetical protein